MTGSTSVARQASDRSLVAGGAYRMVRISATGLAARKDDHRRRGCRENRRMAAREVPAIHALGGGFARSFGARCEKAPGGGAARTVESTSMPARARAPWTGQWSSNTE